MTEVQKKFIDQICAEYEIDPQAWKEESDVSNVLLMMVSLLWGHARTLEQKVERLEEVTRHLSAPDDEN